MTLKSARQDIREDLLYKFNLGKGAGTKKYKFFLKKASKHKVHINDIKQIYLSELKRAKKFDKIWKTSR